jgi:hypothetical protein
MPIMASMTGSSSIVTAWYSPSVAAIFVTSDWYGSHVILARRRVAAAVRRHARRRRDL